MNVFIGTPIRDRKHYCINQWLDSVGRLYGTWHLVMVDNSDDEAFANEVVQYCKKIGLSNYELIHLDNMRGREVNSRLQESREVLRSKFLENADYDYFLSLECDVIVDENAIHFLRDMLYQNEGAVVRHTYPEKSNKKLETEGIGCSMFNRDVLAKIDFIGYGECDDIQPDYYYSNDLWFYTRIQRAKYPVINLSNFLDIKHLGK
jgi:hypothetical protein